MRGRTKVGIAALTIGAGIAVRSETRGVEPVWEPTMSPQAEAVENYLPRLAPQGAFELIIGHEAPICQDRQMIGSDEFEVLRDTALAGRIDTPENAALSYGTVTYEPAVFPVYGDQEISVAIQRTHAEPGQEGTIVVAYVGAQGSNNCGYARYEEVAGSEQLTFQAPETIHGASNVQTEGYLVVTPRPYAPYPPRIGGEPELTFSPHNM